MGFQSLEQRMAQTYLDSFPPFIPSDDGPDIHEQEQFYHLMLRLYQMAYDEPMLFVTQPHEDDAYPNRFNKSSYGKPELAKNMRAFTNEVDGLLKTMFQMGAGEEDIKLSKRRSAILQRLGIDPKDVLPAAWVWMCTREGADMLSFSRCLFRQGYPYMSDIYAKWLGNENAFRRLEYWLAEHDYARYDSLDGKLSLDYANPAWDQNAPRGGFQYKIRHTGISLSYDDMVHRPPILGLCIPNGMKQNLQAFERMEARVKDFVVARTKRCDSCGYCVQTDKTGTRPKAYVPVTHKAKTYNLCSYFPGYFYCWTSIDEDLVDNLTAMLSFMDSLLERP